MRGLDIFSSYTVVAVIYTGGDIDEFYEGKVEKLGDHRSSEAIICFGAGIFIFSSFVIVGDMEFIMQGSPEAGRKICSPSQVDMLCNWILPVKIQERAHLEHIPSDIIIIL